MAAIFRASSTILAYSAFRPEGNPPHVATGDVRRRASKQFILPRRQPRGLVELKLLTNSAIVQGRLGLECTSVGLAKTTGHQKHLKQGTKEPACLVTTCSDSRIQFCLRSLREVPLSDILRSCCEDIVLNVPHEPISTRPVH